MLQFALLYVPHSAYHGQQHYTETEKLLAILLALGALISPVLFIFQGLIKRAFRVTKHGYISAVMASSGYEYMAKLIHGRLLFFRLLSISEQKKFLRRVAVIKDTKTFAPRDGLVLTEDMEILISATQAVLTFGLDEFVFETYLCYHIFPDNFYSGRLQADVKGLTFPHTHIMLSWKAFEEGFANETDKINLGLHEMAHALHLEFKEEILTEEFEQWRETAIFEFSRVRLDMDSGFLRNYGGNNLFEFWAVCVENFFEAPVEFKAKLPELYTKMCLVLNQDMAQRVAAKTANEVPSPTHVY